MLSLQPDSVNFVSGSSPRLSGETAQSQGGISEQESMYYDSHGMSWSIESIVQYSLVSFDVG